MVGVQGCEGPPLVVDNNVSGGYCEVGGRRVFVGREAGSRIEVEDCEVGICGGVSDEGTPCLRLGPVVRVYQAWLWALKSAMMMLSPRELKCG